MKYSEVVARNVLITYGRMAITVFAGIWTTRLVLQGLGAQDYGIFIILGSVIFLLRTVSDAFIAGTTRFLAFEIGRDSPRAMRRVFTTSLVAYVVLACIVAVVGMMAAAAVCGVLTIPPERERQARFVFRAAVVSFAFMLVTSPYVAAYRARQALAQDAWFALLTTFVTLIAALALSSYQHDRLVAWAAASAGISVAIHLLQVAVATYRFYECRPSVHLLDWRFTKEFLSFSAWAIIGGIATKLRGAGSQVLLNLFFGPVTNTAFWIGSSATGYMRTMTSVINRAVAPAMTTRLSKEGSGRIITMMLFAEKMTLCLALVFAIPIWFHASTVIQAWLGVIPEGSVSFMASLLVAGVAEVASLSHVSAAHAAGEIGRLTRFTTFLALLPVPLSAVLFALGWPAVVLGKAIAVVAIGLAVAQVVITSPLIGSTVGKWLRAVVYPAGGMAAIMVIPHVATLIWEPRSMALTALTTAVGGVCGAVWLWYFGLDANERTVCSRLAPWQKRARF